MSDQDFYSDSDYLPCENCGEEIYVDAVQCPYCGWYITDTANDRSARWDGLVRTGLWVLGLAAAAYLALWLASQS